MQVLEYGLNTDFVIMWYTQNMSKKTLNIQEYELPITIQEEKEGGFTASCSVWKDCYAQGETVEEALANLTEATELYLEEFPLTTSTRSLLTTFHVTEHA